MRRGASAALALAVLAGLVPAALRADPETPFLGPEPWTDIAPATYQIRSAFSTLCIEHEGFVPRIRKPYLRVQTCGADLASQHFELVPNGTTTVEVGLASNVTWRIMNFRGDCATTARGVLIGPPSIDSLECGTRPAFADNPALIGAADQTWRLRHVGPVGKFMIWGPNNHCWTIRGEPRSPGAEVVSEPCDGRAGQWWEFGAPKLDVTGDANQAAAEAFGWFRFSRPPGFTPARFRSMRKLNLPSGDYTGGIATADDQGAECANLCAADNRCVAFTWVDPRARGGTAMCYKKNVINRPVADNFTNSGIIRPM